MTMLAPAPEFEDCHKMPKLHEVLVTECENLGHQKCCFLIHLNASRELQKELQAVRSPVVWAESQDAGLRPVFGKMQKRDQREADWSGQSILD